MGSAARKLINEGFEMGKYEGIQKGEYNKAVQTAKHLLYENISIQIISGSTGLSISEINKIKQEIEK